MKVQIIINQLGQNEQEATILGDVVSWVFSSHTYEMEKQQIVIFEKVKSSWGAEKNVADAEDPVSNLKLQEHTFPQYGKFPASQQLI